MTMRVKGLVIAAAVLLAAPAAAHAEGRLKQLPSPSATNLSQPSQIALSPDSRQLYAVSSTDGALAVLDRDPASGTLTQRAQCFRADGQHGCETGVGLASARAVAVSPDGKSVYVGGGTGTLAVFDRAADGTLKQKSAPDACFGAGACQPASALSAPRSIAISPDGTTLYAMSPSELAIFDRDSDGSLQQKPGNNGCIVAGGVAGCAQALGFGDLRDITVSPDGHNLYGGSNGFDMILTFDRAPNGTLTAAGGMAAAPAPGFVTGDRIANAYGLAVSPDGRNLYSASWSTSDSGIAILDRDPATGALSQAPAPSIDGCVANGDPRCRLAAALDAVYDVAISGDGANVYAATSEGVAVFDRLAGGDLMQKPLPDGCFQDRGFAIATGCMPADGTTEERAIAVSPDGGSVYAASPFAGSIAAFARELPAVAATPPTPPQTQTPAAPQPAVVTSSRTSTTKLIAKLRSRSFKSKRGKAFRVAYVSTIRGTATLQVLKGRKRVLTMKSSNGKAFRVAKKLARGRYTLKLTLKAGGQTAGDSAKLTVR
jgi:DNA-binding beta-propeller fold protein YncE